jgi:phage gpG-like protein
MENAIGKDLNQKVLLLRKVLYDSPREIGSMAVNHFKDNFVNQSFDGVAWDKRKKDRSKDKGRALLVKSGTLKRSIRVISADTHQIVVGTDVVYAQIHNEGGTIIQAPRSETFTRNRHENGSKKGLFKKGTKAGKGFTFKERTIKIPKRQFMGESKELTKRVDHWYKTRIGMALK